MRTIKPGYKKAFSMIELIFVIVVLGIVASIGSEMIAKVYGQYIIQRAQHRASLKTELAALQIANRIRAAIPGTVYRIKNDDSYESVDITMTDPEAYRGLQWVSADMESFNYYDSSNNKVGWSGFCDVNNSTASAISTPGSDISTTSTIMSNLGYDISHAVIYFPEGFDYNVSGGSSESISISSIPSGGKIFEHYKLARSSYALVCENHTTGEDCGDLSLYYNFSPLVGTAYSGGTQTLLLKNVTSFRFTADGGTIRFKICKEENIGEDFNITSCKEKAVF
jgi:prepilin-type N-terminal cleavage/methylation domain-containing protein